jgi:hypothetical protein
MTDCNTSEGEPLNLGRVGIFMDSMSRMSKPSNTKRNMNCKQVSKFKDRNMSEDSQRH